MTRILLTGVGSAGVRFGFAAELLGWSTNIIGGPEMIEKYRARFAHRYGRPPHSLRDYRIGTEPTIGVIATPPRSHSSALEQIMAVHKHTAPPSLIICEKPMLIPSEALEDIRLHCDSQMAYSQGFREFLGRVRDRSSRVRITAVQGEFRDSLNGARDAHGWNPNFVNGWILDEIQGGGALFEYCHPLFWIANLLEALNIALPEMKEKRYVRTLGPRGPYTTQIELEGSSAGISFSSSQEMVFSNEKGRKELRVEFSDGVCLRHRFLADFEPSRPASDTANFLRTVAARQGRSVGANVGAVWVDEILGDVWSRVKNNS